MKLHSAGIILRMVSGLTEVFVLCYFDGNVCAYEEYYGGGGRGIDRKGG